MRMLPLVTEKALASWGWEQSWELIIANTVYPQISVCQGQCTFSPPCLCGSLVSLPFFPSPSLLYSPQSLQSLFWDLLQWNWGKTECLALPYKTPCMDCNSALTREFSDFPSPLGGRGCKQLVKSACWMKAKCGGNDWVLLLCCQMEFASRAKPTKTGSGSYQRRNLMHVCFYPQSSIIRDFCIWGMLQTQASCCISTMISF